jgi:hypothetical protein
MRPNNIENRPRYWCICCTLATRMGSWGFEWRWRRFTLRICHCFGWWCGTFDCNVLESGAKVLEPGKRKIWVSNICVENFVICELWLRYGELWVLACAETKLLRVHQSSTTNWDYVLTMAKSDIAIRKCEHISVRVVNLHQHSCIHLNDQRKAVLIETQCLLAYQ